MNHIAPLHEPLIREVPLSRLALAPENVRKTPADPVAEAEMKASIATHGLLENLVVRMDGPADAGAYAVIAGGRRLAAMKALAEDGTIDADHPVPCLVAADPAMAGELSLAENIVRIAMHPADQVIAFTKLADAGLSVGSIAARFGTAERLVEQRLRLGNVAPDLLDAYRADEIDLEVLKAFSVTPDHARQMAAWEQVAGQGYRPSAWQVKRLLTEERIPGTSAVARFVGVEPYEAAGGKVLRDLFSNDDDSAVWFDDPALLNNLAVENLRVFKDELETRWKWATAMVEVDWNTTARYGRIYPEPAERTPEEQAEIEKLEARQGVLAELDDDAWTEELVREAETIEERLDEIEGGIEARAVYRREDFGIAGCIATIGRDGTLQVIHGLVRPEDMPKEPEAAGNTGARSGDGNDGDGHTAEAGTGTDAGRISVPAMSGPMNLPKDREAEARKEAGVGIGLADDLRSIRTALVKARLAGDFEAAFDLMLFQLGRSVFTDGYKAHALDIAVRETADRPTMRMNDADFAAWSPGRGHARGPLRSQLRLAGDRGRRRILRGAARAFAGREAGAVRRLRRAHGEGAARLRALGTPGTGGHGRPPRYRLRQPCAPDGGHAVVADQQGPDSRHRPLGAEPGLGFGSVEEQEARPREGDGGGLRGRRSAARAACRRPCGGARLAAAGIRGVRYRPRGGRAGRRRGGGTGGGGIRSRPGTRCRPRRRCGEPGDARRSAAHELRGREHRGAGSRRTPGRRTCHRQRQWQRQWQRQQSCRTGRSRPRSGGRPCRRCRHGRRPRQRCRRRCAPGRPPAYGTGERRRCRRRARHSRVPAPRTGAFRRQLTARHGPSCAPPDRRPAGRFRFRILRGDVCMNHIARTPPAKIRARIHDNALKRVTRIYASTLADVLTETLQNSRRGGATGVRISVGTLTDQPGGETRFTVTIADDGTGIADPAVLLSFGENGWSDDLVRREDAAGFGFASLSRRGCTVASRPRSPDGHTLPGWRVDLAPEHFLGEAEAEVHADDSAPFPHGTSISFEATESAAAIRNAAENAARHYPLEVFFEGIPCTEPGGQQLDRRAFLDGAIHAEPWRGLAFGVFRNRHRGYNDPDLNFFGLTVPLSLPTVESVHGGIWSVRADIGDCPDLELVLPARKEAVENDFLKEMRSAARLAIYRAMAADPEPRPAFDDWKRARDAGIDMAPPPAVLRPWRPGVADVDDWREPPKLAAAVREPLVMACDPEPPEAQALWRAAERAGIASRLFEADRRLDGYDWYDGLDRVTGIETEIAAEVAAVAAEAAWLPLDDFPLPELTVRPRGAFARTSASHPDKPRRHAGAGAGPDTRSPRRSRLRGRGLVLDRRGPAAGDRRQRFAAAPARGASARRLLFAIGRCGFGLLGDPARPLRPGSLAYSHEAARIR